jgi:hypothetical protein
MRNQSPDQGGTLGPDIDKPACLVCCWNSDLSTQMTLVNMEGRAAGAHVTNPAGELLLGKGDAPAGSMWTHD